MVSNLVQEDESSWRIDDEICMPSAWFWTVLVATQARNLINGQTRNSYESMAKLFNSRNSSFASHQECTWASRMPQHTYKRQAGRATVTSTRSFFQVRRKFIHLLHLLHKPATDSMTIKTTWRSKTDKSKEYERDTNTETQRNRISIHCLQQSSKKNLEHRC